MKKMFVLLSVAMLSLGCLTTSLTAEPAVETATTDPAKPIEVQAGETFVIVVDANPSTGYHWEFVGELGGNVIEFVSSDYKADEPAVPGSGGVDVWTFKAISAGQAQITLGSYPPGVDDGEPEQTLTFEVIVK